MVLDFLKKDVASLEINLEPQGTHKAGDVIRAQVTMETKDELKIRQCRIALFGEVKYQVRSRQRTKNGTTTSYRWDCHREEYSSQVLMEAGVYPAQLHQNYAVTLQIPEGAPHTTTGKIIRVNWFVKANLDRPNAVDVIAESGLVVSRTLPEGLLTKVQDDIEYANSDTLDADISFWLPRTEWALGETIQARLSVLAHKDVKFSDIRVELIQCESVPESAGNQSDTGTRTTVAEKTEMTAGQSLTFPFQITIPADGAPTLDVERGSIYWKLKGVLARQLATDYHTEKSLEVYSKA